ncbi:MAG: hypothetical protein SWK76_12295 [Actinomycetota bacterium]|nr:hypothetical protein [Actinomycetota bacterium]
MKGRSHRRKAMSVALVCAALLVLLTSQAPPAPADVPPGAAGVEEAEDLDPIWLFDEDGELVKFEIMGNDVWGFSKGGVPIEVVIDGVEYPDGELDLDEVIAFRALQLGITQLWPEDIPDRENLAVAWTDPSPVMEGIMEYMTTCVSRDAYDIDVPAGTDYEDLTFESYRFVFADIEDDEGEFETQVLEEVFPEDFFELKDKVVSFEASVEEEYEYREQWEEVRELFLAEDADALFDLEDEEESVPVWPLIFSLGLLLAVAGTTIYGAARGKK